MIEYISMPSREGKYSVNNNKITIEFSPREIEILCGSIANFVPADKMHEMILVTLYTRMKRKLEDFLQK